ncbi:MAG: hypothetical protein GXP49_18230 [Deltaproteobacteria bacterium]|nr:hypothetical protein [Deltaproteobacteria bacterium]
MVVLKRMLFLSICTIAIMPSIPAQGRVSLEIFAMKPNKFAEKSLYDRLTWDKKLKLSDRAITAFKNVYPDNRLLPEKLKTYPVIEVTGVDQFLKAYTSAKGWFNPTMKIFTKVAKDNLIDPPKKVIRLGFNESSVPLIAQEIDRIDRVLDHLTGILDKKLDAFNQTAKNVQARLQVFNDDLVKERQVRKDADNKLSSSAALYAILSGGLAVIVLLGLFFQAQARKKSEAMLKAQLEKGSEPSSYLKL